MNVYNPTIQIAVGGLRVGKNAAWFGSLTPGGMLPSNSLPFILPLADEGESITSPDLISVLSNGVVFNAALFLQLVLSVQISDASVTNKFLGCFFDGDPPAQMRSQAAFVQGWALYAYNGLVNIGDTLRFSASSDTPNVTILAGQASLRVDAYV